MGIPLTDHGEFKGKTFFDKYLKSTAYILFLELQRSIAQVKILFMFSSVITLMEACQESHSLNA